MSCFETANKRGEHRLVNVRVRYSEILYEKKVLELYSIVQKRYLENQEQANGDYWDPSCLYSSVQKGHKIKPKQANGDYWPYCFDGY